MKLKIIFILCFLVIYVSGCGSAKNTAPIAPQSAYDMSSSAEMANSYDSPALSSGRLTEDSAKQELNLSESKWFFKQSPTDSGKLMFIKLANVFLKSKTFDKSVEDIRLIVQEANGYFESSSLSNINYSPKETYRKYNATIRVPIDTYDDTKRKIEAIGILLNSNESMSEVSGQYYDIQSRLKTKQIEEERLLTLIDQAADLEQLITLERRLGEVRTDIALYQSSLSSLENLTSYSTINIGLEEIMNDEDLYGNSDDFLSRISKGFKSSLSATIGFLQNVIIFLAYIILPLSIIAIFGVVIFIILKKFSKKENKTNENE